MPVRLHCHVPSVTIRRLKRAKTEVTFERPCANKYYLYTVIAGFFTGGALAVRGGVKAARNSAIMCACFLAVIEGVGIGFQRMMAENTRLDVSVFQAQASFLIETPN